MKISKELANRKRLIDVTRFDGIVNNYVNDGIPANSFKTLEGVELTLDGRVIRANDFKVIGNLGGELLDATMFQGEKYFFIDGKYLKKENSETGELELVYEFENGSDKGNMEVFDTQLFVTNQGNDVISTDGKVDHEYDKWTIKTLINTVNACCIVGEVVYFVTEGGGLFSYNISTEEITYLKNVSNTLHINDIKHYDGYLYCGISDGRLYKYNISTEAGVYIDIHANSDIVYCLLIIGTNLYIGTGDTAEFFRMDFATETTTALGNILADETKLLSMVHNGDTKIFAGTGDNAHIIEITGYTTASPTYTDRSGVGGGDSYIYAIIIVDSVLYIGASNSGRLISWDMATLDGTAAVYTSIGVCHTGETKILALSYMYIDGYDLIIGTGNNAYIKKYKISAGTFHTVSQIENETLAKSLVRYSNTLVFGGTGETGLIFKYTKDDDIIQGNNETFDGTYAKCIANDKISDIKYILIYEYRSGGNYKLYSKIVNIVDDTPVSETSITLENNNNTKCESVRVKALSSNYIIAFYQDGYTNTDLGTICLMDSIGRPLCYEKIEKLRVSGEFTAIDRITDTKAIIAYSSEADAKKGYVRIANIVENLNFTGATTFESADTTETIAINLGPLKNIIIYVDKGNGDKATAKIINDGAANGSPVVIDNGGVRVYALFAAGISSTQIIVAYSITVGLRFEARILNINGNNIYPQTPADIVGGAGHYGSMEVLSASQAVMCYKNLDPDHIHEGTACLINISGNNLTPQTPVSYHPGGNDTYHRVKRLTDTKAIVAYARYLPNDYANVQVLIVNGNLIEPGTSVDIESVVGAWHFVSVISATKVLISYRGGAVGRCCIVTVSGNVPTPHTPVTFEAGNVDRISGIFLSITKVLLFYNDSGDSYYGKTNEIVIDGNTVTPGTPSTFNSESTSYISAILMGGSRGMVSYRQNSTGFGRYKFFNFAGLSIEARAEFESGSTYNIDVAYLTATQSIVGYEDCGDGDKCKVCLIDTTTDTLSPGAPQIIEASNINLCKLKKITTSKVAIIYNKYPSGNNEIRILTINGAAVTPNTPYIFNNDTMINFGSIVVYSTELLQLYYSHTSVSISIKTRLFSIGTITVIPVSTIKTVYTGESTYTVGTSLSSSRSVVCYSNATNQGVCELWNIEKVDDFTNLGTLMCTNINLQTLAFDDVNNILYVGTDNECRLYSIDTSTGDISEIGQVVNDDKIYCMLFGNSENLYIGVGDTTGHVFTYNITTEAFTQKTAAGGLYTNCTKVLSMLLLGGKLYLGGYSSVSDGKLVVYDLGTTFTDKGVVKAGETGITCINTYTDNIIFLGSNTNGHLVEYNIGSSTFTDKGSPSGNVSIINEMIIINTTIYLACTMSTGYARFYSYSLDTQTFTDHGLVSTDEHHTAILSLVFYAPNGIILGAKGYGEFYRFDIDTTVITKLEDYGGEGEEDVGVILSINTYQFYIGFGQGTTVIKYGSGIVVYPEVPQSPSFPHCKFIKAYNNMMFAIGDDKYPNTLMWSKLGDPTDWTDYFSYMMIGRDDDKLVSLLVYKDYLIIFKNHSIYSLTGYSPTDLTQREFNINYGCDGAFQCTMGQNEFYFIYDCDMYMYRRGVGFTKINHSIDLSGGVTSLTFVKDKIYIGSENNSYVLDTIVYFDQKRRAFYNIKQKKRFLNLNYTLNSWGSGEDQVLYEIDDTLWANIKMEFTNWFYNAYRKNILGIIIEGKYNPSHTHLTDNGANFDMILRDNDVNDYTFIKKRLPVKNKKFLDFIITNNENENFELKRIGIIHIVKKGVETE